MEEPAALYPLKRFFWTIMEDNYWASLTTSRHVSIVNVNLVYQIELIWSEESWQVSLAPGESQQDRQAIKAPHVLLSTPYFAANNGSPLTDCLLGAGGSWTNQIMTFSNQLTTQFTIRISILLTFITEFV